MRQRILKFFEISNHAVLRTLKFMNIVFCKNEFKN